jgi:hypothetical protein
MMNFVRLDETQPPYHHAAIIDPSLATRLFTSKPNVDRRAEYLKVGPADSKFLAMDFMQCKYEVKGADERTRKVSYVGKVRLRDREDPDGVMFLILGALAWGDYVALVPGRLVLGRAGARRVGGWVEIECEPQKIDV